MPELQRATSTKPVEETSSTTPPDTITDELATPTEAPPVEDPMQALTEDAALQYDAALARYAEMEATIQQLYLDANLNFTGDETTGDGYAARSRGAGLIVAKAQESWVAHQAAQLSISASMPAEPTASDYLSACSQISADLELFMMELRQMSAFASEEAMLTALDAHAAEWLKKYVTFTQETTILSARLSRIESLREDRSIVQGLIDALQQSSTGE